MHGGRSRPHRDAGHRRRGAGHPRLRHPGRRGLRRRRRAWRSRCTAASTCSAGSMRVDATRSPPTSELRSPASSRCGSSSTPVSPGTGVHRRRHERPAASPCRSTSMRRAPPRSAKCTRPTTSGCLARIAAVFADFDVDVTAALVSTLGDRVVDVFYMRDAHGAKLTDPLGARAAARHGRSPVSPPTRSRPEGIRGPLDSCSARRQRLAGPCCDAEAARRRRQRRWPPTGSAHHHSESISVRTLADQRDGSEDGAHRREVAVGEQSPARDAPGEPALSATRAR